MRNIIFKILTTDYDFEKVNTVFKSYCKKSPFYSKKLKNLFPKLIQNYKEVRNQKLPLRADILIVEDDVICIVKYFNLIEAYVRKYNHPVIKSVIACTKADAVYFCLSNLTYHNNPNPVPKLIILDFDLQEKKESAKSILKIVEKIENLMWYDTEYLAVSGFKSIEGAFKPFEDKLKNEHHRTYEKERLDDRKLMLDNLEFLLNRTQHQKKQIPLIQKYYKEGEEAFKKLERQQGQKRIQSTILFLDNLENGIKNSCEKMQKLNADIHRIPTMSEEGKFYSRSSLTQELKCKIRIK